ncbi:MULTISPECIES: recombinase family protein [Legionella]|uniref:Transposase (Resolvase, DNA invertase) n=2 Tax=Legionella TaxID=445 RepID=A0A0W1AMB1_9GAMM|nr:MULTISPECIES: recombinase family protein [Legionella]KTD82471.1 transposase (resolvase, DNA invertase) [Legionella waltersii]MCZ4798780.1 recombinase family protein [Legionella pneumophila]RJT43726.1 recombinase family protein [Legionella taurinensis]SNU95949.1 transposase (resolvase, DNA invertase) [Legionella waltersii]
MKIGYARVSTLEQNLDLQIDALEKAGCKKIITDEISGSVAERPGLTRLKEDLREGDTVVVWRLDRLGRSLKHLIALVNEFELLKVGFESLQESINTTTSTGQLIFHMFGALAEFERNLIRERTKAGLASARARGRQGGRPKQLNSNKRQLVIKLYKEREHTVQEICRVMGISKPTLYQYLREAEKAIASDAMSV